MFLHSVGVSLTEFFNLVSNAWYVEIVMQSIIGDVARCVDNDSEVFELFPCLNWRLCSKVEHCKSILDCFVQQQFTFDRQLRLIGSNVAS